VTRTALVFGHSTGLGAAVTDQLIGQGFQVVGISRSRDDNVDGLTNLQYDLADSGQIEQVIECIESSYPQFDVLVWAAGTLTAHSIDSVDYRELEYSYKVNTFAPMAVESALLDLIKANETHVVNITSSSVVDYYPQFAEYSSSKAALVKFTHDLWTELRPTASRVTDFCPSGFASNMYKVMSGDKINRDESVQMNPADLARIIGFLIELPKKVEMSNVYVNRK
jgi:short-subunit dehydrogenase